MFKKALLTPGYKLKRKLISSSDSLSWYFSRRRLQKLLSLKEPELIIKASKHYQGYGIYTKIDAWQVHEELLGLAKLVDARKPRSVLEIGTARGGTLFVWCRMLPQAKRIISLDLPGGRFGGGYAEERTRLYQEFVADRPQHPLVLMRCNSHEESTRDAVVQELGETPLDFLWIDADHTYEGVRTDFYLYEPLVAPGGMIAFHDIVPRKSDDGYGVDHFWREIKQEYEHQELVKNWDQGQMGIGVLFKPA